MFLTLVYFVLIFQVAFISLLLLPISTKIRHNLIRLASFIVSNQIIRAMMFVLIIITFGLFIENIRMELRYSNIKDDFDDKIVSGTVSNKHEVLIKMFRAQRNTYLTFFANFNWIIVYGLHQLFVIISNYEARLSELNVVSEKKDK